MPRNFCNCEQKRKKAKIRRKFFRGVYCESDGIPTPVAQTSLSTPPGCSKIILPFPGSLHFLISSLGSRNRRSFVQSPNVTCFMGMRPLLPDLDLNRPRSLGRKHTEAEVADITKNMGDPVPGVHSDAAFFPMSHSRLFPFLSQGRKCEEIPTPSSLFPFANHF